MQGAIQVLCFTCLVPSLAVNPVDYKNLGGHMWEKIYHRAWRFDTVQDWHMVWMQQSVIGGSLSCGLEPVHMKVYGKHFEHLFNCIIFSSSLI